MDQAKVREVLAIYRAKFKEMEMPNIEFPKDESIAFSALADIEALSHCNNMLDQIEAFIKEDRMDKVFRWLGFMQGVLWRCGIYTVGEMANHNRP